MPKIYLSPSNQDDNIYATGSTNEMEQCNLIAEATKVALERNGFEVLKAPAAQTMSTSIAQSNAWGADVHIPIHTNAGGGEGTEIFIYNSSASDLANSIINQIVSITPSKINRGVKVNRSLSELKGTIAVAIYIEVDFHDNITSAQWIIANTTEIGEAICKGICEYYNVEYKSTNETNTESPVIWEYRENGWVAFKNGEQIKGWVFDKGNWYFLDTTTGNMKTGWIQQDGNWYYCQPETGEMLTGWFWDNSYQAWFYFNPDNGRMVT